MNHNLLKKCSSMIFFFENVLALPSHDFLETMPYCFEGSRVNCLFSHGLDHDPKICHLFLRVESVDHTRPNVGILLKLQVPIEKGKGEGQSTEKKRKEKCGYVNN